MENNEDIYYFLYSEEQIQEKNKILAKTSKRFSPGTVSVGSKKEKFSQLSRVPELPRFVDTKIVASGNLHNFVFKMPEVVESRS